MFYIVKKALNVKATDFKDIVVQYPEFLLQQRKHILKEKIVLIRKHTKVSDHYFKDLFLRHPELFLKSYASLRAKVRFLKNDCVLLCKFNYGQHIRPRCDIVAEIDEDYDPVDVCAGTDEEF